MNPRPVHTGTQRFFFSRTFRHYVMPIGDMNNTDIAKDWDMGWCHIPYEHIAAALKIRDWQMINTVAKRWKVLECGFNMTHIIPFMNDTKSVGGTVGPYINFNLTPYMESYIDKGYQLPINGAIALPNGRMSMNDGKQADCKLQEYNFPLTQLVDGHTKDTSFGNWAKSNYPLLDLMNSSEWGTIQPTDEFSFEHKFKAYDAKWRHAILPLGTRTRTTNDYVGAHLQGRWDGGYGYPNEDSTSNYQPWNKILGNAERPCPAVLIRPQTFYDNQGAPLNLAFQVVIKYHAWVELDVNDMYSAPIFIRNFITQPPDRQTAMEIYDDGTDTGIKLQNPGSNLVRSTQGPGTQVIII